MTADLLLTGARVVDARRDLPGAWVQVRDGLIAAVGSGRPRTPTSTSTSTGRRSPPA